MKNEIDNEIQNINVEDIEFFKVLNTSFIFSLNGAEHIDKSGEKLKDFLDNDNIDYFYAKTQTPNNIAEEKSFLQYFINKKRIYRHSKAEDGYIIEFLDGRILFCDELVEGKSAKTCLSL